jgi:thioredoxin-like negative regulator of GroEL
LASVEDVQAGDFDEVKRGRGVAAVEFWVRSCGECQKFRPVYEQLPEVYGGRIRFLRMNMLKSIDNLRLAEGLGVEETPTTVFFCDGEAVGEIVRHRPLEEAVEEIESILKNTNGCP